MKLYHYAKQQFPVLRTRASVNPPSHKEMEEAQKEARLYSSVAPYFNHISFFFDRAPLKLLGRLFKGQNEFWSDGNRIYEHVVDVDTLEQNILYRVVESPLQMKMLDEDDKHWIETDEFLQAHLKRRYEAQLKNGEIGTDLSKLKQQIEIFTGCTEAAYRAASMRSDFDQNIRKYAASVPHLMLYPSSGEIAVESSQQVVVGRDLPPLKKVNKPAYAKW